MKLTMAINEEYSILKYLILMPSTEDTSTVLVLPETLQAPHLRHLTLSNFALPIGSRLLMTAPRLKKFQFNFFNQLTFSIPHLLQFLNTSENLRFDSARFLFEGELVYVEVYLREEAKTYAL